MIDLHLHLDGSLPPSLLIKLAEMEGIILPGKTEKELLPYLTAPRDCKSLNEYLEKFSLPVSCMQSEDTLREAAKGLALELARQGLIYAEIRFAPQLHKQKGLTQKQVVEAVLYGLRLARKEAPSLQTNLILCCMRGQDNEKENWETVELAGDQIRDCDNNKQSPSSGNTDNLPCDARVCAVDLAGAEALFPTKDFSHLFAFARELKVPFTIHAGEAAGPESIEAALSFGARRLGHGVRVVESPEGMEEVISKQIPLELCMTSNLQTKALPGDKPYPLLFLLRKGVKVTVNTDNMTVSGTTIEEEFSALRAMGMTQQEEKQLLFNAVEAAFLSETAKNGLRKVLCPWRLRSGGGITRP